MTQNVAVPKIKVIKNSFSESLWFFAVQCASGPRMGRLLRILRALPVAAPLSSLFDLADLSATSFLDLHYSGYCYNLCILSTSSSSPSNCAVSA